MIEYDIEWSAGAEDDLTEIYLWIAAKAGDDTAHSCIHALRQHMEKFSRFPERGTNRSALSPGLRTTPNRGTTVMAYRVEKGTVVVVSVLHAGRDWSLA